MLNKIKSVHDRDIAIDALNQLIIQEKLSEVLNELQNIALAQGGLTQLAQQTGIGRESLYKILHPKSGNPRIKTFFTILNALGITLSFKHKNTAPNFSIQSQTFPALFPDLAKQWNASKNSSLSLNTISPLSQKKVWWMCSTDFNHEWRATCFSRSSKNTACPICTKSWLMKKKGTHMEKNIRFNNDYISMLKAERTTFDVQLLTAILHEVKHDPDCEKITYIHYNPLPIQVHYDESFERLTDAKTLMNKSIRESRIKQITLKYPSDSGQWQYKIIWQREK